MKKALAMLLSLLLVTGALAACGGGGTETKTDSAGESAAATEDGSTAAPSGDGVELRVVTSFSGTDGNRPIYEAAYKAWESETGNVVKDESQTSDETWKAKVVADFETGSEPDVLFFFNGIDSNSFVEAGKVVTIDTIRAEYPDYASNMIDESMAVSPVDGQRYTVPTTGYWEGLYVNKTVLDDVGVDVPGPDTTWEDFLEICQEIKDAGYTPIACSLQNVPHYWFEFTIMNNGGPADHLNVPETEDDAAFKAWASGENDIKELYELGYFPDNTLSASDDETFQLMYDDKAAFAIDGSWKAGQILENVGDDRIEEYTVTYVPGKGDRKATDIIGGLSMGYFITQKAWDDPEKRDAAVSFVEALTADGVIADMAAGAAATALKTAPAKPDDLNPLQEDAYAMVSGASSVTPAVQDYIKPEAKTQILETDTKLVANGTITAEEAVNNMISANS